jgi:hypothetical protein
MPAGVPLFRLLGTKTAPSRPKDPHMHGKDGVSTKVAQNAKCEG